MAKGLVLGNSFTSFLLLLYSYAGPAVHWAGFPRGVVLLGGRGLGSGGLVPTLMTRATPWWPPCACIMLCGQKSH